MRGLLRRIGARTGISIGLIIVIVAVVTVARLIDDQRVTGPVRPPTTWAPEVAATEGDDGPIADPAETYTDDEAVLAAVAVRQGEQVDEAALQAHCRAAGLPTIKIPERVLVLDSLPKNAVGKIAKRSIVEIATAGSR